MYGCVNQMYIVIQSATAVAKWQAESARLYPCIGDEGSAPYNTYDTEKVQFPRYIHHWTL